MFVGPVFTRELATGPRRARIYISRAVYGLALFLLMWTAYMMFFAARAATNISELARFGAGLFPLLALVQLAVTVFFAALLAASAVAQEKDRRTLVLLLLTNLTNSELVLGKLFASFLQVFAMLAASLPLFMLTMLFGGVALEQVIRAMGVMLASTVLAASLGSTLALWREKTFQTLALTALIVVLWFVVWQIVGTGALGATWAGIPTETWSAAFSPWQALVEATQPQLAPDQSLGPIGSPVNLFLMISTAMAVVLNLLAIAHVRRWNTASERTEPREEVPERESIWDAEHAAPVRKSRSAQAEKAPTREVWDNPILWREMRTRAYGRRMLIIKLAYILFFGLAFVGLYRLAGGETGIPVTTAALAIVPLQVLSLVLINAQAVTALTNERDAQALDLLLVTDITPKEFIYGKLGGVFYNAKEMVALPLLLSGCLWLWDVVSGENLIYLLTGILVMDVFVAMLGVHIGMAYANSRSAIINSLGTVFFLFLGCATCMAIMVAFRGDFKVQYAPFVAYIFGGGIGLYVVLGARNPSTAIFLASILCPFLTFYAITSYFVSQPLAIFLAATIAYGFTTLAMLVPAISEFDVATGRTTAAEE
ncbi:MAG: hypothetical protein HY000_37320 [Planctomycetes bacterium]|nr:hypothetical protein [Planctomycetota bacterium]